MLKLPSGAVFCVCWSVRGENLTVFQCVAKSRANMDYSLINLVLLWLWELSWLMLVFKWISRRQYVRSIWVAQANTYLQQQG